MIRKIFIKTIDLSIAGLEKTKNKILNIGVTGVTV